MKKNDFKKYLTIFFIGVLYLAFVLKYKIGIPCIFHELTGLYCPGCGSSRAIVSLIEFNPYQAFRYNMLVTTLIPFVIIYFFYKYILYGKKKIPNYIFYLLLIITIIFSILRNIPFFYYLAPTKL